MYIFANTQFTMFEIILNAIIWDPSPDIFKLPFIGWPLKWYSIMWLLGFVLSQQILFYIFKREGKPTAHIEVLTIYIFIGTLLGARFGHFLFYQPEQFFTNPLEIILPPYAGLASHGGAIGILIALYLFCRNKKYNYNYLWMVDRLVIVVALTGCCIRLGNLINSEILGLPTDVPWAFVFVQEDNLPRHPAQLYEAIFCLILFVVLFMIWKKKRTTMYNGLIFGIFLITLFGQRFIVEHFKENQVPFENVLPINMGQILSIPFVLIGIIILMLSFRMKSRKVIFRELEEEQVPKVKG